MDTQNAVKERTIGFMIHKVTVSPLIKEVELRKNPVISRVNEFTEDSAKKFHAEIAQAHSTGQKVILRGYHCGQTLTNQP